jgi:Tfp pilus assembly PilM family ATPase
LPDIETGAAVPVQGVDPAQVQAVHEAIEREVNKFIAEVRRSLDYYLTQTSQVRTIQRILLTGSGAQLRNLGSYLEKGLQARVVMGDPLERLSVTGGVQQEVTADKFGAVTAIGLALGGLES